MIKIRNVGKIEAVCGVSLRDFTSVNEYHAPEPVIDQKRSLVPFVDHTFEFKIHPKNFLNDETSTWAEKLHIFYVDLKSPDGRLYDHMRVFWVCPND